MSLANSHLPLAAALALSASCYGSYGDCYDCPPPIIYENEPNNSAAYPDPIGGLAPGDALIIRGYVEPYPYPDQYDGFSFHADAPLDVEFALWAADPYADLDVCVWDPDLGQFVFCFEGPQNPERGVFTIAEAGKPFHLVVRSFMGASDYDLEVWGHPISYAAQGAPTPQAGDLHRPGSEGLWQGYGREPLDQGATDAESTGLEARLLVYDVEKDEISSSRVRIAPLDLD